MLVTKQEPHDLYVPYQFEIEVVYFGPIPFLYNYPCRYGLETFTQLIENGNIINSDVTIDDEPRYVHRGLMLDAG